SAWAIMTNEQPQVHRALAKAGVEVHTVTRVARFEPGEAVIANLFTAEERRLPCRSLVIVGASVARDEPYKALIMRKRELERAGIVSVDRIGDALAPGAIAHAVYSGLRFARELDAVAGSELYRRDAPIVEAVPILNAEPN